MVILEEENQQLRTLSEMVISTLPSLPTDVENSIYYARIKQLLHPEIMNYCKEQLELKEDLNFLRMSVGEAMTETEIREYLNGLKDKYTSNEHVGIEYHIEVTRVDYGVPVFCTIQRGNRIFIKKFVFRFRKANQGDGIDGLSISQIFSAEAKKKNNPPKKNNIRKIMGGDNA